MNLLNKSKLIKGSVAIGALSLLLAGGVTFSGTAAFAEDGNEAEPHKVNISQSVDKEKVAPGETATYTVTVENGEDGASEVKGEKNGLVIVDFSEIGEKATIVNAENGEVDDERHTILWKDNLNTGEKTFTYQLNVVAEKAKFGDTLSTTAKLPGEDDEKTRIVMEPEEGAVVTSTVYAKTANPIPPILEISHSADKMSPAPGDAVTYTAVINNIKTPIVANTTYSGAVTVDYSQALDFAFLDVFAITVTDENENRVFSSSPFDRVDTSENGKLVWEGDLPQGSKLNINYRLKINDDAEDGTRLPSTLTVGGYDSQNGTKKVVPVVTVNNDGNGEEGGDNGNGNGDNNAGNGEEGENEGAGNKESGEESPSPAINRNDASQSSGSDAPAPDSTRNEGGLAATGFNSTILTVAFVGLVIAASGGLTIYLSRRRNKA